MNLRSVLCAATLFAAAGVAQAFPEYTLSPDAESVKTSIYELMCININLTSGTDVDTTGMSAVFESEDGDEMFSTSAQFMSFGPQKVILINFEPEEFVVNGNWTFTVPAGQFTVDGEENPEIKATYTLNDPTLGGQEYPQITFEGADPKDGSKLAVWGGENLTQVNLFTSDDDAVNYIEWALYDVTGGGEKYIRSGNENRYDFNRYHHNDDIWADGLFISVGGEIGDRLILDHTYRLDLRFCGIGYDPETNQYPNQQQIEMSEECVASVTYYGLTEPQEYAEATYVSVSPNPDEYEIETPEQGRFHITYSAPARPTAFTYSLGGGAGTLNAGTCEPFEGMEADENGLCTVWTFIIDPSVLKNVTGGITTNVQSMDADGRYVKGNADMDFDDINYSITWNCNCGAPALISVEPKAFSEVESLSSITVANEADLIMAFSYNAAEPARILTKDGAEVRVLGEPVISEDELQATWTFDPIVESGTYVLMIPRYYFAIGEEFDGSSSNITAFEYYVVNNNTPSNVTYDIDPIVDPISGSTVEAINDVVLTFEDVAFTPMNGSAPKIQLYVMNGPDAQLLQEIDPYNESELAVNDYWNPTVYTIHFEEVTADGEYQVLIPEGVFCDEDYDASEGESGHANPEIILTYSIGQSAPSDITYDILPTAITPENNTTVEEISNVYLEFGSTTFQVFSGDDWMPKATNLYRLIEGEKELVESVYGMDDMSNPNYDFFSPKYYVFNFSPITEKGQYVVEVEEGTFCDEAADMSYYESGRMNPAFNIYYAIGETVGVDAIVGGESVINVFDINGVQVLKNANVEAAKELKSGLYIINGKKVMIRR